MTDQTIITSSGVPGAHSLAVATDYVILERLKDDSWAEFARESARSSEGALRASLEGNTDGGTFVAIPARSFKPVTVRTKTTTTLHLEEVKS